MKLPSVRVKRGAAEEYRCKSCGESRPARDYETKLLSNLFLNDKVYEATCLRCDRGQLDRLTKERYTCCACQESLPADQFSLARAKSHRTTQRRCARCERPPCRLCGERPAKPLTNQNEVVKSLKDRQAYRCVACKYPPCDVCKVTQRPDTSKRYHVDQKPKWVCQRCLRKA